MKKLLEIIDFAYRYRDKILVKVEYIGGQYNLFTVIVCEIKEPHKTLRVFPYINLSDDYEQKLNGILEELKNILLRRKDVRTK